MKIYTLIAGVNGAGKSSLSGVLQSRMTDLGHIIDVDKITAEQFAGDEYEGGKAAVAQIQRCLKEGLNFTQESTLAGSYARKVAKAAREAGFYVRMFYVGLNTLQEARKRVQNRVAHGGHDIPPEVLARRFERRISSLAAVLPTCNEIVFFDNQNGFVQVAEYRNGAIRTVGKVQPPWLTELLKKFKETS